jgi:hypothetical protein
VSILSRARSLTKLLLSEGIVHILNIARMRRLMNGNLLRLVVDGRLLERLTPLMRVLGLGIVGAIVSVRFS